MGESEQIPQKGYAKERRDAKRCRETKWKKSKSPMEGEESQNEGVDTIFQSSIHESEIEWISHLRHCFLLPDRSVCACNEWFFSRC